MAAKTHSGEKLGYALGVFSVGLGLTQILAPAGVARAIGLKDDETTRKTMRAFGFREAATGIGLLSRPDHAEFAWGRVAGDALDLAVLGRALSSEESRRNRVAAAMAAVAGVTVLDLLASSRLSRQENGRAIDSGNGGLAEANRGIEVRKAITVNKPPEEVYAFWRNLENLPQFMVHLESVRVLDARLSYWKARAPLGTAVEWTAEITEDIPNRLLAWQSVEGTKVPNSGHVEFKPAPGDRGTEVHVRLRYDPPGGTLGATIAKLFGEEPSVQVDGDLRRLKQVLEVGEVVHSQASIHRGPHPAQESGE
jgi:uncharacterized membrane protein